MGVSRLDTITHFTNSAANTRSGTAGAGFNYPCNGVTSAIITGTFGGATVTLEFSNDGVNWVPVTAGLSAPGIISFQGCASWVSIKITGGTGASITASTCHNDNG